MGMYKVYYESPLGMILLIADNIGLIGAWFEGQKFYPYQLAQEAEEKLTPILQEAIRWLEIYFAGKEPDFTVTMHMQGTAFQEKVWELLRDIPYGETVTYGELAQRVSRQMGRQTMSAQAVGGAVGRNKLSIFIPCHRVLGADGSLTGYAGGVERKKYLLALETGQGTRK